MTEAQHDLWTELLLRCRLINRKSSFLFSEPDGGVWTWIFSLFQCSVFREGVRIGAKTKRLLTVNGIRLTPSW